MKIELVGDASKAKATTTPVAVVHVAPSVVPAEIQLHRVSEAMELPAVLAGPIVRRSQDTAVYVWICTSTPVAIEARAFLNAAAPSKSSVGTSGSTPSTPFGHRLHATLIKLAPEAGKTFPRDTVIFYDMTITSSRDAFKGDVAFHPDDLSYSGNHPAFILPSDSTPTVLLQGSCRKLHGPGRDAMKQADEYMKEHAGDVKSRPQQLLLTGDQIYADEVHSAVLALAQKIGPEILGYDEVMPPGRWRVASQIAGGKEEFERGGMVRKAGFTSDEDACLNHLMAFADYMTVYLLGWSGGFWKFASDNYAKLVGSGTLPGFDLSPAAAQRLFANVPTYMMCDDHEVTDDWYIDAPFKQNSVNSPLLRRILLNAVSAYWVFQGWGNDPAKFSPRGADISNYLTREDRQVEAGDPLWSKWWLDASTHSAAEQKFRDYMIEAEDHAEAATAAIEKTIVAYNWFFVTPLPANVIMLDTRTRRVLFQPPKGPGLLNMGALGDLEQALRAAPVGTPVVIVSPPPVFGHDGFEWLQKVAQDTPTNWAFYALDYECWSANDEYFFRFLTTIQDSGRKQIVFFAGDVHYAYASSVRYRLSWPGLKSTGAVEVLNLTASSIKNHFDNTSVAEKAEKYNTPRDQTAGRLQDWKYTRHRFYFDDEAGEMNVFLNWDIHPMPGPGLYPYVLTANNIGVFTMERGKDNPRIDNCFIDDSGNRHLAGSGTWQALMAHVGADLQPVKRPTHEYGPKW